MSDSQPEGQERRNFYRLNDDIIFDYCVLDEITDNAERLAHEPILELQRAASQLRELDAENQLRLQEINTHHPNIGNALRTMNKKIDVLYEFLSQELLAKFILKIDERECRYINISAGGIAFSTDELLEENTPIQCKMILKPSYDCVLAKASVVSCIKQQQSDLERPYRVSVKFHNLSNQDEQVLARYIFQRQVSERRQDS